MSCSIGRGNEEEDLSDVSELSKLRGRAVEAEGDAFKNVSNPSINLFSAALRSRSTFCTRLGLLKYAFPHHGASYPRPR
jgi:hypothetical protein